MLETLHATISGNPEETQVQADNWHASFRNEVLIAVAYKVDVDDADGSR